MRGIAIVLCLHLASCFGPRIDDGVIDCSANGLCPPRFLCADDGFCRRSDVAPDASPAGSPDACGSACDLDFQCVATLGEARLDSNRATRQGGVFAIDTLDLPGDGDPSEIGAGSELVHCGEAIYLAIDGLLHGVPVAPDAT